ncbi:MAG TPA: LLM class flavin-dependent oxidoreductase [Acidimicrobiales bacterium]
MRLGTLLPTFRDDPADALAAGARAMAAGLDGVFAYDHLWPMGSPERPALAPFEVLTAVAVRTQALVVGTLVARVGLVTEAVSLGQFRALRAVAGDRVIAALGTGDALSREENLAYGVDFPLPDVRRASMRSIAGVLQDEGMEVWIGAGAPATRAIAVELGCTLNLWAATPADVAAAAKVATVSWAGPTPLRDGHFDEDATAVLLDQLEDAGATWAVFDPRAPIEGLAALRGSAATRDR